MHAPLWEGVLIKASGAIDAGFGIPDARGERDLLDGRGRRHDEGRARRRAPQLIDVNDPEAAKVARELPDPVEGVKMAA